MHLVHEYQMNFRQLRTFVAIADAGGFANARGWLHLSQPAATRQIQALEREFGVPLFDRVGRRLRLTSEGHDLLHRSRQLLQNADALGERARELKGGQTGTLWVGASTQHIETVLADFLPRYRRGHPHVSVHLVEDGGARQPDRLEQGDVHLAFIVSGDTRFFSYKHLAPVYVLAVMPRAHRLKSHATLDIKQLSDEPLLLLHHGFGSRAWFDSACRLVHMTPRVVLESAAPHAIMALVATGHGIGIVPSNVLIPENLLAVPLMRERTPIGQWVVIAWDPQRFLAAYAEDFVGELVSYCQKSYPNRRLTKRAPPLHRIAKSS
jgi:DNA-binding transcriptional LysR family regulator